MTADVIAVVLGLGVGLSLGALGGGGSTLAVPILVFVAGMQAQAATSASLLVVGAASAIGAWGHYRNGNVRLGVGLAFGAAGALGARVGTSLNRSLDEQLLLLLFSALIFFVAIRMYRSIAARQQRAETVTQDAPTSDAATSDEPTSDAAPAGSTLVATRQIAGLDVSAPALVKLAAAASAVGLLTGLFGVGGGFAIVPALTLLLGFGAKEAIGTSLVVIAINAAIALTMRSGSLGFEWALVLPFLATVTIGVVVGSRIAHNVDADRLTRSFAVMLGIVAAYTAASSLLA